MNLYMYQCKVTYPAEVDMISHEQYAILKQLSTAYGYVNNFNTFFCILGGISRIMDGTSHHNKSFSTCIRGSDLTKLLYKIIFDSQLNRSRSSVIPDSGKYMYTSNLFVTSLFVSFC